MDSKLKKLAASLKRRRSDAGSSSQPQLLTPTTVLPRPASALGTYSSSPIPQALPFVEDSSPQASVTLTPSGVVNPPLTPVGSPNANISVIVIEDTPPSTPLKKHKTSSGSNTLNELFATRRHKIVSPLSSAIGQLVSCFKELETVTRHRRGYEELTVELVTLSKLLKEYTEKSRTIRMSEFIENIAIRINEQIQQIEAKRDRSTGRYLINVNEDSDDLARWYQRIGALFRQLQTDISLSTLEVLDEQMADHRLEAMMPVKLAVYNSIISIDINRRGCTEGTRVQVLLALDDWARTTGTPNIYWMNGMAGTGKTAIAYTFAQKLKERKSLGASFFCTRTSAECGNVGRILPTIAYQLALYSTPFRFSLCRILGNDRDLGSQTLTTQFGELIMKSLLEVADVVPEGLVVIIDALDECSHKGGAGLILDLYWGSTQGLLSVDCPALNEQGIFLLANWKADSEICSLSISPNGTLLVIGSCEGSITLRDAQNGSIISGPTDAHSSTVNSLAYSPDGTRFVSGSTDPAICIWNTYSGSLVASSQSTGQVGAIYSVVFSSDGRYIASGSSDCSIRIWDSYTCSPIADPLRKHTHEINSVAFSPDNQCIAFGSDDYSVQICSTRDGSILFEPCRGHTALVWTVIYSPDGTCIASGSRDSTIRIWNAHDGTPLYGPFVKHTGAIQSISFSPDGVYLVSASIDQSILVWNVRDGTVLGKPLLGHTAPVKSIAFSLDGSRLFSGSTDHNICVWGVPNQTTSISQATPRQEGHSEGVIFLEFSSNGDYIISGSYDGTIRTWRVHDGSAIANPLVQSGGGIRSMALSPNGAHVAHGKTGAIIRICNLQDGKTVVGPYNGHVEEVTSITYSSDGSLLVSAAKDCLCIWRTIDGSLVGSPLRGHTEYVWSVSISSSSEYIAPGSEDQTMRIWKLQNGQYDIFKCLEHPAKVRAVAFSPGGAYVASGSGSNIGCWDPSNGDLRMRTFTDNLRTIISLAYSRDGSYIASGLFDGTLMVYDAHSGTLVAGPFLGHTGPIRSVAFSPNKEHIISGSNDKSICIRKSKFPIGSQTTTDLPPALQGYFTRANDGWVKNSSFQLLFWIPKEAGLTSISPYEESIITTGKGPINLDFTNLLLGEQRDQCYLSE